MKTKVWAAKVAFVIPEEARKETGEYYPGQVGIPPASVDSLMGLFDDCEFISAGLCNPDLLVVEFKTTPTPRRIKAAKRKIETVLAKATR